MVSSARPSVVVKICASTMLAPAAAQAPAMIESRRGWSGASTVSSVTPRDGVELERRSRRVLPPSSAAAQEARMRDLVRQIDLQPVGRVVPRDIGVESLRSASPSSSARNSACAMRDALRAVDLGEAAGQHQLGLVVERAQQLRLPAVPDARADRPDVGDGQDEEQLQALQRSARRRRSSRWSCGRRGRATARRSTSGGAARPARRPSRSRPAIRPSRGQSRRAIARAGDRMVLGPALGDVVQEQRDIEQRRGAAAGSSASARWRADARRCRRASISARMPIAAQQMLVHRVVVVHVELHHRDDAAEVRHEAAEHAGLVHPPQHHLGDRCEVRISRNSRLASGSSRSLRRSA